MIEIESGTLDKALISVNKALVLNPKDAYATNNRGLIYVLQGELPKALEDINASILLDPTNAWAYRNKGIYYLRSGDSENALRLLLQAKQMDDFVEGIDDYIRDAERTLHK